MNCMSQTEYLFAAVGVEHLRSHDIARREARGLDLGVEVGFDGVDGFEELDEHADGDHLGLLLALTTTYNLAAYTDNCDIPL